MKNLFARMITLLLVVCLVLSLAACGGNADDTTEPTTEAPTVNENPTESTEPTPTGHNYIGGVCQDEGCGDTLTTENPLTFLSLSMGENYDNIFSMMAYDQFDGTIYLEQISADRKRGTLPTEIMINLAFALEESGLLALVGQDAYNEGEANGNLYAEYADGTSAMVGFSGTLPQEFIDGFNYMDAYFTGLTADMTPYVPEPSVMGDVNADDMAELQLIIDAAQLDNLDSYSFMDIPKDEYFGYSVGVSNDEGITRATAFSSMNMTTAYSITLLTLEDASYADAVCSDLENNLDWRKWVCVAPSNALIAVKDGMVLILLGSDALYDQTVTGIEASGWTTVQTLTNPDF